MDPLGRPPSANSGSYATIASLNKFPLSESKKSCKPKINKFAIDFMLINLINYNFD